MTPKNQILKTKLKELESMFDDEILLGPETTQSYEEIKQKIDFIGNLILAETKSHSTNPQHLQHISQRFESMRKSFNERDTTFTTFSNPEFDMDSLSNSNSDSSSCSCTQFCLDDDEVDGPKKLFPKFVGEKAIVEFRGNGVDENSEKINVGSGKIGSLYYQDAEDSFEDFGERESCLKEEENIKANTNELEKGKNRFGKNCCVLVSGIVMSMVLMGSIMVNISSCVESTSFAIPT